MIRGTTLTKRDERMRRVGTSKITKLRAKPGMVYPLIRLPKTYADEIGKTANILEIQNDKQRAVLVTFDGPTQANSELVHPEVEVIQPESKVIQPKSLKDVKACLIELKSEIEQLKEALLSNESKAFTQIKNRWARGDSNARPSPWKGDVIDGSTDDILM